MRSVAPLPRPSAFLRAHSRSALATRTAPLAQPNKPLQTRTVCQLSLSIPCAHSAHPLSSSSSSRKASKQFSTVNLSRYSSTASQSSVGILIDPVKPPLPSLPRTSALTLAGERTETKEAPAYVIREPKNLEERKKLLDLLCANADAQGGDEPPTQFNQASAPPTFCTLKAGHLLTLHASALERGLLPSSSSVEPWETLDELGARYDRYTDALFDMTTILAPSGLFVNFGVNGVVIARVNPKEREEMQVWHVPAPAACFIQVQDSDGTKKARYLPTKALRLAAPIAALCKEKHPDSWNEHDFRNIVQQADVVPGKRES